MLNTYFSKYLAALVGFLIASACAVADGTEALRLQPVSENVYAVVGPFGNRNADNLGNNATFGFVVTEEGVVLIDTGGTYQGAAAIAKLISQVTNKPVKVVINTGGQDHRWLGNGYFKERGARIIASRRAVEDQQARARDQFFVLGNLVGDKGLEGTDPIHADEVFEENTDFTLGGVVFELRHVGQAHTPGDTLVWLPHERIVFAGDVVYVGRMLGVMSHSNSRSWIETFEAMAALEPTVVIPGHGPATDITRAKADTLDYLVALRESVGSFMEAGGSITDIGTLDQSRFEYLVDYDTLKGRNAQQVFQEMEWE